MSNDPTPAGIPALGVGRAGAGCWEVGEAAGSGKGNNAPPGTSLVGSLAACQEAMDGLGVALGRHALVAPDLKAGRLVVPFDFKMSSDAAYYLVYPTEAIRRRKIKAFRDWIVSLADVQQDQPQQPRAV